MLYPFTDSRIIQGEREGFFANTVYSASLRARFSEKTAIAVPADELQRKKVLNLISDNTIVSYYGSNSMDDDYCFGSAICEFAPPKSAGGKSNGCGEDLRDFRFSFERGADFIGLLGRADLFFLVDWDGSRSILSEEYDGDRDFRIAEIERRIRKRNILK